MTEMAEMTKTPIKTNLNSTDLTMMDPRHTLLKIKAFRSSLLGMLQTRFLTQNAHFSPRNASRE